MSANEILLSDDGREATVSNPDRPGWKVRMRSQRPEGFLLEDLENARVWQPPEGLVPGQRNTVRSFRVGGHVMYVHLLTGPPTWPLPLVQVTGGARKSIMVGWLRAAVAVAVVRREVDE